MVEGDFLFNLLNDNRNDVDFNDAIKVILGAINEYEKLSKKNELPSDKFSFTLSDTDIDDNRILNSLNIKTHSYLEREESLVVDDDPFTSTMEIGMKIKHYSTCVEVPVSLFKEAEIENIKKFTKTCR